MRFPLYGKRKTIAKLAHELREAYAKHYVLEDELERREVLLLKTEEKLALKAGQCPAKTKTRICYLIDGHPGNVHLDLSSGWAQPWLPSTNQWNNKPCIPDDPLKDAPKALKDD